VDEGRHAAQLRHLLPAPGGSAFGGRTDTERKFWFEADPGLLAVAERVRGLALETATRSATA
jgi:hypothetical protein